MSLLLLIDGYNVVAPVAPPGRAPDPRWLHRERMLLIGRLVEHLDRRTRKRCCVVFDAANPPPDRPSRFEVDGIDVRFAVDHPEADDLLEELISAHSAPKQLAVVSSDARVQLAARRRGSTTFDSQLWLDCLLEGQVQIAPTVKGRAGGKHQDEHVSKPDSSNKEEIDSWMREFGFDDS